MTVTTSPIIAACIPDYGTLADVKRFIAAAHDRGIRVIAELVVNHTSDQHPWFQRARTSKPGSMYRDFYVWSNDDRKYAGTRIIFVDSERSNWTWDDTAKAYYWHRFYHHQPDLNFDNPAGHARGAVRAALLGRTGHRRPCGWMRCRIWWSVRAPTTRTCRKPMPR